MSLILPQTTLDLLNRVPVNNRHPGLQLDKLSVPGDQMVQKQALEKVVEATAAFATSNEDFSQLRERWLSNLQSREATATVLHCKTTGPLTLHLSRASALENAGICLHPLYGFVYLPGSGLKGMAHAYAETVWLPTQSDAKAAWPMIEDVFGWAPNPERKQQIRDPNHPAEKRLAVQGDPKSLEIKAHVGDVIFHDAWPETWPKLIVDIVNNHHPDYYQHADNQHAPGDWENPVPVYFLAAPPGVAFTFPLAKRRRDVPDELVSLATEWLLGALCHLGAGAKTNAGYGAFAPTNNSPADTVAAVRSTWQKAAQICDGKPRTQESPAKPLKRWAEFSTTLELVTPAFLAGANQQAEDCDLRPATLRGHLRWWWRTMHAGFLDVQTLRALEAAIWGDTKSGGAVRIVVEKRSGGSGVPYDKSSKANFSPEQKVSDLGIPNGDPRKTTQGLWYASYGMDESNRRRFVLEPPASWCIRLIARPAHFSTNGVSITALQALQQARSSLWLLTHFGGVGSKAGKGFGSLSTGDLPAENLDSIRQSAADLRQSLSLGNQFNESAADSASLQQMLGPVEVTFNCSFVWTALDQVGFAWQTFAKKYKHKREKMALGLPRRIGNPAQENFRPTSPDTTNGRHTSPVRIHVDRVGSGWLVRAVAFPATHLPDLQTSRSFLKEFLKDFEGDLRRRANLQHLPVPSTAGSGGTRHVPQRPAQPQQPSAPSRPQPGQRVEAKLLAEKTKKGGWKAKHELSGLSGPIQNTGDVPGDKTAGDTLTLIVASANEREIAFRYLTAADEQRSKKGKGGM